LNIREEKISLTNHTNIAENIMSIVTNPDFKELIETEHNILEERNLKQVVSYIEDLIGQQEPLVKVLRLLCLVSLVNNGIKDLDFWKTEILQSYGYEAIFTLNNLEKLNLIKKQATSWNQINSNWSRLNKAFNLLVEEDNPNDVSHLYAGYAPFVVRLIDQMINQNKQTWKNLEEVLGPLIFNEMQPMPEEAKRAQSTTRNKVTLIMFLGGVTFAEISSLRFLSKQMVEHDFIIATTRFANGNTLLESVFSPIENLLNR